MISLDTNVVIRLILNDDRAQAERARKLITAGGAAVQMGVLLETAWVLRHEYGFGTGEIVSAMQMLIETSSIETPAALPLALKGAQAGLEIDDAILLADCAEPQFATFDKKLAKRAARAFDFPQVITP